VRPAIVGIIVHGQAWLGALADRRESSRTAGLDDATVFAKRGRIQDADHLEDEMDPVMPATIRVLLRLIGRRRELRSVPQRWR
jgi:hypothetical protein